MRIGGLDRFFQVNVNTLATIPLKGILVSPWARMFRFISRIYIPRFLGIKTGLVVLEKSKM
jgi:hypothetical protein